MSTPSRVLQVIPQTASSSGSSAMIRPKVSKAFGVILSSASRKNTQSTPASTAIFSASLRRLDRPCCPFVSSIT